MDKFLNAFLYIRNFSNTKKYFRFVGRLPNYVRPVFYSEKLQWRKLFDRNPLYPIFCDKLAVRDYVNERVPGVRMANILWSGADPYEIPFDSLPDRYVVKPSHRSGDVYFVLSPADAKRETIIALCHRWFRRRYGRGVREWAYKDLKGQILVEEMLETDPGMERSRDFRFHVFDGTVCLIVVDFADLSSTERKVVGIDNFYDRAWNEMPFRRLRDEMLELKPITRPECLDQMIAAAEALGKGVDYIRADFYLIGDEFYFSEITIYPGSGYATYGLDPKVDPATTDGFEVHMGRIWQLPEIGLADRIRRGIFG